MMSSKGLPWLGATLVVVSSPGCAAALSSVPGTWQMQGYGEILEISSTEVVRYDLTDISCIKVEQTALDDADRSYERLSAQRDGFTAYLAGGVTRYAFRRIGNLPERCGLLDGRLIRDPEYNLSVLWHAFLENYAFFDLRHVNWHEVYREFRPRVGPEISDGELFDVFVDMLGTLDDGHVRLEGNNRRFSSGPPDELRDLWMSNKASETWESIASGFKATVRSHVDEHILDNTVSRGANGSLQWGWAEPGIAYLNVQSMWLRGSDDEELPLRQQLRLVDEAMAEAIAELSDAAVLIVDARFNRGGEDAVALQIMGHLTGEERYAFSKEVRDGSGFSDAQMIGYAPRGLLQYRGPIVYLQSGGTISAAEIFTLAMLARPNVTRVGSDTYGVLSDELSKRLPNGWTVTMSNEVYRAMDGTVYEGTGIPPDERIEASADDNLSERLQRVYAAGLSHARKKAASTRVTSLP